MTPPKQHDTGEIVIAATLWLMRRYRQTACPRIARMIEQHLAWMRAHASSPGLADACRCLSCEWRAMSAAAHAVAPPTLH